MAERYKFENTRAWVRLPIDWYVKYTILDPPGPEALGTTRDISAGGLRMGTRQSVPLGTRLSMKINTLALGRAIAATGRVVRCLQQGPEAYEWGVVFEEISEQDRMELNRKIEWFQGPKGVARHQRSWRRSL